MTGEHSETSVSDESNNNLNLKAPLLPLHRTQSNPFNLKSFFTLNNFYVLLGPLLSLFICLFVKLDTPNNNSRNMLAVIAWVFSWWVTSALPLPVTSMCPLFLFPLFGIASADTVAHSYMDDVITLVLGSFILALAVERYNVHRRLALTVTSVFCGEPLNPALLLLGLCGTSFFVSMWMHNVAAAVMLMPVATGLLQRLPPPSEQSELVNKFSRAVVLTVVYAVPIGGMSTLTGTGVNLILIGFSTLLVSQGTQLAFFLKKILKSGDSGCLSKREFMEAITLYLNQRSSLTSNDLSKFCTCGGKRDSTQHNVNYSAKQAEIIDAQQKQLEGMKYLLADIKREVKQIQFEWDQELSRLESHIKSLEGTSSSYHKVLEENRSLYNQVIDLKGSIRVYCRVRPFLPGQSNGQSTVDYIGENGNIMIVNPLKQGKDARKVFSFNKVFPTNATQEQIYVDTRPLVRSVLDGYNACIFAYGQTGSGKTYTMSGPDLMTEETWGVNYRALQDLFHISKERADAIKYEVGVQMIEIYNEQVRDLLVSDGSNRRLEIRNNSQLNGLNVPDACLVPVSCTQDVLDLMKIGQRNRAVGATALNERSSRSHSVLTVHVRGMDVVSNSVLKGCLHLVDLAGSERVEKSEAVGERLKEAQHINKSLSALGDVISALAQKSQHIPYRNSKLTQVLQDSLGGHAKTLMFVHINPEISALGETISTLKFAERVASIELGAAKSNKETGEIRELKEEISNIKSALERKETELEQWKTGNARNVTESQKPRAVSPFRMPKYSTSGSMKPENSQRSMDDRSSEAKNYSSGKQRRPRFPSTFMDKDSIPKMSLLSEEKSVSTGKGRSPSPPIRRSISTDRGSVIKSKTKIDNLENQPISKNPFTARTVPVNKSIVTMTMTPHPQEPVKHDFVYEPLFNAQKVSFRKVHREHEEQQVKQPFAAVRQSGVRNSKADNKVKAKHHQRSPFRIQKTDLIPKLIPDMDITGEIVEAPQKCDYSEPENDFTFMESAVNGVLSVKKMRHNISRNSQNHESRRIMQEAEPLSASKVENKLLNVQGRNLKEGTNTSMHEFKRSRSTPRGKFFVL